MTADRDAARVQRQRTRLAHIKLVTDVKERMREAGDEYLRDNQSAEEHLRVMAEAAVAFFDEAIIEARREGYEAGRQSLAAQRGTLPPLEWDS